MAHAIDLAILLLMSLHYERARIAGSCSCCGGRRSRGKQPGRKSVEAQQQVQNFATGDTGPLLENGGGADAPGTSADQDDTAAGKRGKYETGIWAWL